MAILVDSNILCRLARKDDPQHEEARKAVDLYLQKQISEWSARPNQPCHLLRMFEANHAGFWERIDVYELTTVSLGPL